jgi:ADP-heptose:LPS heptosyltransferase
LKNYEINPLILCEPKDVKTAEEISGGRFVIFHSQSFNKFSGMISQLDLLFTPDTSIVHIASAFKVPVFGLYVKYKTKDMIWSPYKSDFDAVVTEEKDFLNLDFEKVKTKFLQFFERIYNERKNS